MLTAAALALLEDKANTAIDHHDALVNVDGQFQVLQGGSVRTLCQAMPGLSTERAPLDGYVYVEHLVQVNAQIICGALMTPIKIVARRPLQDAIHPS